MKKPWLSKTLWTNFLIAAVPLFSPEAAKFLTEHPLYIVEGLAIANIVLRAVTHGQLSLQDDRAVEGR